MKGFLSLYKEELFGSLTFITVIAGGSALLYFGSGGTEETVTVSPFLFMCDEYSIYSLPALAVIPAVFAGMLLKARSSVFFDFLLTVPYLALIFIIQTFLPILFIRWSVPDILLIATIPMWIVLTRGINSLYFKKLYPDCQEPGEEIRYPLGMMRLIIVFFSSALLLRSGQDFKEYVIKKYQITVQGKIIEVKDGWLKYEYEAVGKTFSGSVSKKNFRFLNKQGETVTVRYSSKYPEYSVLFSRLREQYNR